MNALPGTTFAVRKCAAGREQFMWDEEVVPIEGELLRKLEALTPGTTLTVDFEGVSMSSDAARRLLKRAIQRIRAGGEWDDRSIVLTGLGRGLYNVRVMLMSEQLATVVRGERGEVSLVGSVEPSAVETFDFLTKRASVTAKDVQRTFELNTVAAATNRLVRLVKLGVVKRVGQEPVEGGGLQYRYAAIR